LKWYFEEPLSNVALTALRRFQAGELDLIAPDCLVPELGHSFRKLVLGKKLSYEDASNALGEFGALQIPLAPSLPLSGKAMQLAATHMATFYDALYMSLAIREGCPVLTADQPMVTAFAKLNRTLHLASFE
jgi:predicted nucleic acid-binding protein